MADEITTEPTVTEADAATTTTAPIEETGTIAAGNVGEGETSAPADWPEDWRQRLAGTDEKLLARLNRFNSPNNVFKSWLEADKLIRSGTYKKALPENPSDDDLKAFRAEHDVPDDPAGYDLDLGDGRVIGEDDKPLVDAWVSAMHAQNAPRGLVKAAVGAYYDLQEKVEAERAEQDRAFRAQTQDSLRAEWGPDYRGNVNQIANLFGSGPDGLLERLLHGRTADGRLIGDDPDALRFLAGLARELNPAPTVVPGTSRSGVEGINDRLNQIRDIRRKSPNDYWKNDSLRAEELKLIEAQQKLASRAA